jgi:hypothetical protein
MHNEIELVEARMQIQASKQWEAVQAARKRAMTKESNKLAQEKWIKDKEEERAKEDLWQQVQHDEKYMAPGQLRADGSRLSAETDIRNKWGREELQGLMKLEAARRAEEKSMEKRIATEKAQQESEAKREEVIMSEGLAARKKRVHMEALEHQRVAAWKASVRAEDEAHLEKIAAQQHQDTLLAEKRITAVEKKEDRKSAAHEAEEVADVQHGEKVVLAVARATERQVREKAKMIKEEQSFRKQALHEIALEEKDAVAKKEAKLRLEQKVRERELAVLHEQAARRAHEEREALRSAQIRRRQAWEREHEEAEVSEKKKLRALQAVHETQERKMEERHKADEVEEEKMKSRLQEDARDRERKVGETVLVCKVVGGIVFMHEVCMYSCTNLRYQRTCHMYVCIYIRMYVYIIRMYVYMYV